MTSQVRVLALSTRRQVTRDWVVDVRERLNLGERLRLELLTAVPPARPVPAARVDVVDLSRVPWRPVVPVAGEGLRGWGGSQKFVTRALRASRKAVARARGKEASVDPARALEIACRTSPALRSRAAAVDVIVALDGPAARSVAALGRRARDPLLVFGARNVRAALESAGRQLQPTTADCVEVVREVGGGDEPFTFPKVPTESTRLLIAPANYAGQAHAWAESVRRHVDGATAINVQVGAHPHFPFSTHVDVDRQTFNQSFAWRNGMRSWAVDNFTHVIAEANRPFLGQSRDGRTHVAEMRRAGARVALLSHGSDARIPSVHMAAEQWHSYAAAPGRTLAGLERNATSNCAFYNSYDGTVFVSTPGLLAFIPEAVWLPLVVEVDLWQRDDEPLCREVPVVAHIPSSWQKGSHVIDPILESLDERGLIRYRRLENLTRSEMPEAYGSADIVVEQFGIADYSTAAVEAMASGRVVISRVADRVRGHVEDQTGLELPIIEANPETLEAVIVDAIADRDGSRAIARRGVEFARTIHDGRRSASVLAHWLTTD